MLSRLAMLKKNQHTVKSWNSLQIWSSLWLALNMKWYGKQISDDEYVSEMTKIIKGEKH